MLRWSATARHGAGAVIRPASSGAVRMRARTDYAKIVSMSDNDTNLKQATTTKTERPRLYKVLLVNDDFTPREFVVAVLRAEFRMSEDEAVKVMMAAHQQGVCVVAVFPRDVAETKATRATDAAKANGFPLMFATEPEA